MPYRLKLVALVGAVAFIAGCAPRQEPVVVTVPPPVQPEPSFDKF